uniref:Uncharacterized protein n=1 Tax=Nelumbo nucifera TaxID=4432 RepID=A0A822YHM4_NELNU|nr:TPA_asm: hypothetical protein HUJ06_009277 [Nelumbo nucifera]
MSRNLGYFDEGLREREGDRGGQVGEKRKEKDMLLVLRSGVRSVKFRECPGEEGLSIPWGAKMDPASVQTVGDCWLDREHYTRGSRCGSVDGILESHGRPRQSLVFSALAYFHEFACF